MKIQSILIDFVLKEWLLIASGVGFVLTSVYTKHFPSYSTQELQVLFILFALFVAVKGLQRNGLISRFSQSIEEGKAIPLKLVATTFFLSMLVTNDVALIVVVPLTLTLNIDRKDILVIFEALAANAGSALTPFGNPQNLFIYWYYDLHPVTFITTIAPFSLTFLIILAISSFIIKTKTNTHNPAKLQNINMSAYIYGFLLIIVLLTVLHVLPFLTSLLVVIFALLFDRKTLRVDYALLFSFFFFFGLAENMKMLLASEIKHSEHVFLFSALASQIISNVPATLLFAKFTTNWEALLWGTNVGGFGSLFGSLANLIAYKLYVTHENTNNPVIFTAKFLIIGYMAFFLAIGLYFILPGL
ncbi:MAG: hypothetical protein GXP37_04290 [Chloroflexi bacterium]|nr:hypothetical protein [Chloroflexota bacterium]